MSIHAVKNAAETLNSHNPTKTAANNKDSIKPPNKSGTQDADSSHNEDETETYKLARVHGKEQKGGQEADLKWDQSNGPVTPATVKPAPAPLLINSHQKKHHTA